MATSTQVMWLEARQTTTLCASRGTRPATKLLWGKMCMCKQSSCIYKTVEGARRRGAYRMKWWPCCCTNVKRDRYFLLTMNCLTNGSSPCFYHFLDHRLKNQMIREDTKPGPIQVAQSSNICYYTELATAVRTPRASVRDSVRFDVVASLGPLEL